jgi:hypothetical protein
MFRVLWYKISEKRQSLRNCRKLKNVVRAIFFSLSATILGSICDSEYRGADKSLARPGRKQATATEDFEFHISHL